MVMWSRRLAWIVGAAVVASAAVGLVGMVLARPAGLRVSEGPAPTPSVELHREDFWTAIRDVDLESAARQGRPAERRRFALALQMVVQGRRADAIRELETLNEEAKEARIQDESREALVRLLRATAGWEALRRIDPEGLEGEAYSDAEPQQVLFPKDPVRLATRIGWLRVPRLRVELNGRPYTFAVDTGADPTVITDEVANTCGIQVSDRSTETETSTRHRVEWRAAVARELRLGGIVIRNHPLAVVRKADLDLGLVQLDGILGWPIFEQMRVEIDYANGMTTLTRPGRGPAEQARNLFWLGYPMVGLRSRDGVPLYFGLDTGARDTSLNENILNKASLGVVGGARRFSIGAGGAEAVVSRRVVGFSVLLGGREFLFEKISIKDGVKNLAVFAPDGRLGGDVAFRGKMIVDFANGRFELEAPLSERDFGNAM